MPDWYPLLRASRYLGVAPWDLLTQPLAWREWALQAEESEMLARENQEKRRSRKAVM